MRRHAFQPRRVEALIERAPWGRFGSADRMSQAPEGKVNPIESKYVVACGESDTAPKYGRGNDPLLFEQESKTDGDKLAR